MNLLPSFCSLNARQIICCIHFVSTMKTTFSSSLVQCCPDLTTLLPAFSLVQLQPAILALLPAPLGHGGESELGMAGVKEGTVREKLNKATVPRNEEGEEGFGALYSPVCQQGRGQRWREAAQPGWVPWPHQPSPAGTKMVHLFGMSLPDSAGSSVMLCWHSSKRIIPCWNFTIHFIKNSVVVLVCIAAAI